MNRLLPNELVMAEECQEEVNTAIQEVIDGTLAILADRGEIYDQHEPMWHRMQLGEIAFAVMVGLKARRAGAVLTAPPEAVKPEKIDDILLDLLAYTLVWAALRKVRARQYDALSEIELPEPEPEPEPEPAPVAAVAPIRKPLSLRKT